jgi:hypothetical protein
VNIRLNLRNAVKARLISESEEEQIIGCVRSLYFPKRSMPRLHECMERNLAFATNRAIVEMFAKGYKDYKREDAIKLLTTIADSILP